MIIFSVLRSSLEKSTPPSILFPDTLKGVDDLIRTNLEAFRDSCFGWLLAATLLVVVGLVCEGPELWDEITSIVRHWRFRRRFRFSLPEEHSPNWAKLLAFIGWTLIVVGVAGEFVADTFVSRSDGFIQKFDEILLAETTKNAGGAADSAKIAHEEADAATLSAGEALRRAYAAERSLAKAESDAVEARTVATGALATARDASTRAGKAEASLGRAETAAMNAESSASNALALASEARKEAASFEDDLARLKKQAADRDLNEYQQQQVKFKVGRYLGTTYELAVSDTTEAERLLLEIDAAIDSAGWIFRASESKAFRFTKKFPSGKQVEQITLRGIEIGTTRALSAKFKPAADALATALNAEGIVANFVWLPDDDPSPNNIHIMVGSHP